MDDMGTEKFPELLEAVLGLSRSIHIVNT
jgi:hypothetical protein